MNSLSNNPSNSNPFKGVKIEYHILQSFPVSCLNRDDVGSPKSAFIGGVNRARVSSQSWKRQVRQEMHNNGVKLAVRTKKVAEIIATECVLLGAEELLAVEVSELIASMVVTDTLLFFSNAEAKAYAEFAAKFDFKVPMKEKADKKSAKNKEEAVDLPADQGAGQVEGSEGVKEVKPFTEKTLQKELKKASKDALALGVEGLDIALFGRMVAKMPDMDVEAASSFSHAISTHKVESEIDFFTALDDYSEDQGSSHIGSNEFNAAVYYRYISLDLGVLFENLLSFQSREEHVNEMNQAIEEFTKAIFIAVPSGKQKTQSAASFWDFANIQVRKGQNLQVSFESPVKAKEEGFLAPSIDVLTHELAKKEKMAGSLYGKISEITLSVEGDNSIDDVIESLDVENWMADE